MSEIWDATITTQIVDDTITRVSWVAPWCQVEARDVVCTADGVLSATATAPILLATPKIIVRVEKVRVFFFFFLCGDGLWFDDDLNVVQIGSNNTSSLILFTLAQPQPGDTVIWLMTSLYSFFTFISIQHTCSPQTHLQSSHLSV